MAIEIKWVSSQSPAWSPRPFTSQLCSFTPPPVIATKYSTNFKAGPNQPCIMANYVGNGTKSLNNSVNASLEKLQTDYIDILYVHWWDFSASVPEVMQSLNQLVSSGKVLYLGISDTPAWIVRLEDPVPPSPGGWAPADDSPFTARPMSMPAAMASVSFPSIRVDGPRPAATWSVM